MTFPSFVTALLLAPALLANAQLGAAQEQTEHEQIVLSTIEYARAELTTRGVHGKVDLRKASAGPPSAPLAQGLAAADLEPTPADTEFIICSRDGCELIGTKLLIRVLGPPVVEGNQAVVRVEIAKSRADSLHARMDAGDPYVARIYKIGLTRQGSEWVVSSCKLHLMT